MAWVGEGGALAAPQVQTGKLLTSVHMPPFKHGEEHATVAQVVEAGSRISVAVGVKALQVHTVSEQVPRPLQVSVAQTVSTQVRPAAVMSSPATSVQVYSLVLGKCHGNGGKLPEMVGKG